MSFALKRAGESRLEPGQFVFVEIPEGVTREALELKYAGPLTVVAVDTVLLRYALNAYEASLGEAGILIEPPWVPCAGGYRIPVPVVRGTPAAGALEVVEGAASLYSLLSAVNPAATEDPKFPVLLIA